MHYRIAKPGFDPLITHVFVDGDEYLDSDSVFGVRGSCVGQFVRHEPGVAPTGETVEVPFHTLDYRFVLHPRDQAANRSEEHTSELQSLMRISYAVFCLKK